MQNICAIKPSVLLNTHELFLDEDFGSLSPIERLAFIGILLSSEKGCLDYKPKRLRAEILPYDDVNFEKILNNLICAGLIEKDSYTDEETDEYYSGIKIPNYKTFIIDEGNHHA